MTKQRPPSQIARAAVLYDWGDIQKAHHIGPGIYGYSCSGHGGVIVLLDKAKRLPNTEQFQTRLDRHEGTIWEGEFRVNTKTSTRRRTLLSSEDFSQPSRFDRAHRVLVLEEDCDWALAAVCFEGDWTFRDGKGWTSFPLSEILEAKGVNVLGGDFLEAEPDPRFDIVLMNPPFEKSADVEHVTKAFKWLRPHGHLVAIMSGATPTKSTKKAKAFHEFVEEFDGQFVEIPEGSFKESGTGVNTVMLVIEKPAEPLAIVDTPSEQDAVVGTSTEASERAVQPTSEAPKLGISLNRRPSQVARAAVPKAWGKINRATHIGAMAYRYDCEDGGGVLIVRDEPKAAAIMVDGKYRSRAWQGNFTQGRTLLIETRDDEKPADPKTVTASCEIYTIPSDEWTDQIGER